ncbi:MAG: SGNH/GDSL hydrolase family protein [Mucilaginibacter sp.]|nr:SGNH/GDSL hydrolase family protein [Mucilaginibacter sp.]
MKGVVSILLIISALTGCAKKIPVVLTDTTAVTGTGNSSTNAGNTTGSPATSSDGSLTYLALGDSYTIGESVTQDQSFPYQLTAQLNTQLKVAAPTIIATTGWTTLDLINGINNSGATTKMYNFVTLLIGVNDQYQGMSQEAFRSRFIALLNTAIKFANGDKNRVFVISIPDYSVTPYVSGNNTETLTRIALEINAFNGVSKVESDKVGVNYINITDISQQAANDRSLLAPDGLHPSAKMYSLWVQRLVPLVKSKL